MSGILHGVDQRTQLVGHNRVELLLFRLGTEQQFGINVFKVHEAINCPGFTQIPNAASVVCGIAHIRDKTVSVIDLSMAIGGPPLPRDGRGHVIITEYNRSTHGFLVSSVERIIHLDWSQMRPPPKGSGRHSYLTAVTLFDGKLVEIIDVEKVLTEVTGVVEHLSDHLANKPLPPDAEVTHVLVVDDSSVARHQLRQVLDAIHVKYTMAKDGQQAWDLLMQWLDEGKTLTEYLAMVISDIEMPCMDGYTLTTHIRSDPRTRDLYVLLHSSLSGGFNQSMVEKVGADQFLAKFVPDDLAIAVQTCLAEHRHHRQS
jgi:two-component system chemotaxis response regulator CheV